MNDAKTMRTILLSQATSTEVIVGDDVFLMEEVWRGCDGDNSIVVWLRNGDMLEQVDDTTKEWLISAVEAHERQGVPF